MGCYSDDASPGITGQISLVPITSSSVVIKAGRHVDTTTICATLDYVGLHRVAPVLPVNLKFKSPPSQLSVLAVRESAFRSFLIVQP